jgi:hypothetical protein
MIESDITQKEGISDFWVEFDGLDSVHGSGDSIVRFRIIRIVSGHEEPQATLAFHVQALNDGLNGQIARAYDALIDAMRQMTFHADQMRAHYRKEAAGQIQGRTTRGG